MQQIELSKFKSPSSRGNLIYRSLWMLVQSSLFRYSPRFMWNFRSFLLRFFGGNVGRGVKIDQTCLIYDPRNLVIGDNCWIGPRCELYSLAKIEIDHDVALAHNVHLVTASHDIQDPCFQTLMKSIRIKSYSWLAADTFVGLGVTVGEGVVLAARASAFRDLADWSVYAGTPAKFLKERVFRSQ